jgi:outer membrane protein assembly factor BamB
VDLARAEDRTRLLGLTLGIEYNTGRVWECGPDGKVRWEFGGLQGPMEAQVLRGGRVLIAEANNRTVSERDLKGNIRWQHTLDDQPTGCQRMPSGNTFVSTYTRVMELDRDGKPVWSFPLAGGSNAIRRHRNGHVLYALDAEIVEADTAGRKVRSVPLPRKSMYVGIEDLPGDRFLLANSSSGQVLEVDAAGKVLWSASVPGACGVARLPNGHTLVAADRRVVELDRAGARVWEKATAGYVRRVHRR